MNDTTIVPYRTEDEILTYEVSDEAHCSVHRAGDGRT